MRKSTIWCVAGLLVATSIVLAAGSAGFLDDGFGDDGTVVTTADGFLWAVAFQADGKLLAVGSDETVADAWVVRRYNADGTLDETFGATPGQSDDDPGAVAIDSQDRILVAGRATVTTASGRGKKQKTTTTVVVGLVRFESDGTVDTTFGDGGFAAADVIGSANSLAIQSDGKILVSGSTSVTSGKGRNRRVNGAFFVVRYETDGSLDTGFGEDGIVIDNVTGDDDREDGIGIQSDGKIVLAGVTGTTQPLLRRYNTDGSLDTSFGSGGSVFGADGDVVRGVAIDGQDRIVVGGWREFGLNDSEGLVARYTADGVLDTDFADDGIWLSGSLAREVFIDIAMTGNKIVVGGAQIDGSVFDTITYRLDTTGALDTTFGIDGVGELSSPGVGQEGVRGMAVNAAGDIAMGGESPATGAESDWFLIRYCGG